MKNKKRKQRRAPIRVPYRKELGAPPGTLTALPDATPAIATALVYTAESCSKVAIHASQDIGAVCKPGSVSWFDVEGVGDTALIKALGAAFKWHPLVLEDVASLHQRPKAEDFGHYAYVVIHMPPAADGEPMEQLSLLFGEGYVATVQGGLPGDCLEAVRRRIERARGKIRSLGADYLAYAIIDAVIDHYFPVVDRLNSRLEALEQEIHQEVVSPIITEIPALRGSLHAIWRTLAATREALNALLSEESGLVRDETRLHLRDCADHCAQLLDAVEACREFSSDLLALHQATVSNQTGESMRILTLIATIFMPLSFIAGVYGMNFDRTASPLNMPELSWYAGYPAVLGLMVATVIAFLLFFRRRGWLHTNKPGTDESRVSEP